MTPRTKSARQAADVKNLVESIFAAAADEVFEDGMESGFSRHLAELIRSYGEEAVDAIAQIVLNGSPNENACSEALRWLGLIDHPATHENRRRLLEKALSSRSAAIRDSAGLGLSYLDDPRAIAHLKRAIARERTEWVRRNLTMVLQQLEAKEKCPDS